MFGWNGDKQSNCSIKYIDEENATQGADAILRLTSEKRRQALCALSRRPCTGVWTSPGRCELVVLQLIVVDDMSASDSSKIEVTVPTSDTTFSKSHDLPTCMLMEQSASSGRTSM